MEWKYLYLFIYAAVLVVVILRIIYETHSTSKALAYILFCLFLPVFGIGFYLLFGINYWRKKKYSKKMSGNSAILDQLKKDVAYYDKVAVNIKDKAVTQYEELSQMLVKDLGSPLTANNKVTVLANGENKFPDVLQTINAAKHHIHIEYYIYECDDTGTAIIEALISKAKEGLKVRFIYDDFGSPGIKRPIEKRMRQAGIEIFAFHKIRFYLLANRFNYRNHRKILIVDGDIAFMGGINVSDRYVNKEAGKLYWRDTHIKIEGAAVFYLQYLFITDWNHCCAGNKVILDSSYFPEQQAAKGDCYVQVAAGGPDSPLPSILYSMVQAINLAQEEILITTPYFIPGDSIMDAICIAAMSGLQVKLLVPEKGDSKIVNTASRSYYTKLLEAGVEIYLYKKGFVHAKTMVTDGKLSVAGTANMDYRSFELNFEVNAVVYNEATAKEMRQLFFDDLTHAEKINTEQWLSRSWIRQLPEKIARLLSPVL